MNARAKVKRKTATRILAKADAASPALIVTGRDRSGTGVSVSIKAGTKFFGRTFAKTTRVPLPAEGLAPGADYGVAVTAKSLALVKLTQAEMPDPGLILGGFHFAPGGNAAARAGGDTIPAINPCSVWDQNFRPACPDPRGMVLVAAPHGKFWCDIYLAAADHLANGTSQFGVTIADGSSPPENPNGGRFAKFDYPTAQAVMKHHGKELLSSDDFREAAFGVTEKTSASRDPKITGLDAARTSKWGVMQATGNLWVWGHDGDPDLPRACVFGGSWFIVDGAGSRYALVGYWPGYSDGNFGARGRGDHLQLG